MAKQRGQAATKIQASIRRKQAAKAAGERKQAVVAEQNLLLNRKASQIQKLARGRLGKKKVCGLACLLACFLCVTFALPKRISAELLLLLLLLSARNWR